MGARDGFALLAGMDVEMDLLTKEAPRRSVLPLLDFSKLEGSRATVRVAPASKQDLLAAAATTTTTAAAAVRQRPFPATT